MIPLDKALKAFGRYAMVSGSADGRWIADGSAALLVGEFDDGKVDRPRRFDSDRIVERAIEAGTPVTGGRTETVVLPGYATLKGRRAKTRVRVLTGPGPDVVIDARYYELVKRFELSVENEYSPVRAIHDGETVAVIMPMRLPAGTQVVA